MENKNKYESVIIIRGTLTETDYKKVLDIIVEKIKNIVEIKKIEEIGKKRLAYEVNKEKDGYYIVFEFETKSEEIRELERLYRINDDILKFITVKLED